ncbi:MAG: sulfurtransferase tusA [Pseudonocardiales bacterium]|nr:MAG: sulfurtransferase tusA [Pseudonocardiales bacterium]
MSGQPMLLIDGGDLACGELLMAVHRQVRDLAAGTVIGIATTDPAAAIDIPAWCHLTGHRYRGSRHSGPGVAFIVEIARQRRPVDPDRPWHRPRVTEAT